MTNINDSIIESITSSEISNLVGDFGEMGIDSLINDESIKKIPVVSWFVSFYKSGITIRDRILLKKIVRFLLNLNDISQFEKTKFIQEVNTNSAFKKRVVENLLIVLDKLDETEKSELLAKIFSKYISREISFEEWLKFSNIVEKALLFQLKNLPNYYSNNLEEIDEPTLQELYSLGLLGLSFDFSNDSQYVKNNTGLGLLRILFPEDKELYNYSLILPSATIKENKLFKLLVETEINVYPNSVQIVDGLFSDEEIKQNNIHLIRFESNNLIKCSKAGSGIVIHCSTTESGFNHYFKEVVENPFELKGEIINALEKNIETSGQLHDITNIPLKIIHHILEKLERKKTIGLNRLGTGEYLITKLNT